MYATDSALKIDMSSRKRNRLAQLDFDMIELIQQSGVSLLLKVGGGLSALACTLLLGHTLGKAGSGLFFLALAIVTLVSAVSRLGMDQAITRFVSEAKVGQDWARISALYSYSMQRVALVSVFLTAVVFVSSPFLSEHVFNNPRLEAPIRWMSFSIVGFSVSWLHSHFFQGMGEVKTFQFFQNFGQTLVFVMFFATVIVLSPGDYHTAEVSAICFSAASTLIAIATIGLWKWRHPWHTFTMTRENLIATNVLLPYFGMLLINQLSQGLPQIMLGAYREESEVGIYNAAFRIAMLTSIVLMGVNSVVFPRFAALYSQRKLDRLKHLAQTSTLIMTIACLPFLSVLMLMPGTILRWIGTGFEDGANTMRIIALGQLVNVVTGSVGGLLTMTGHEKAAWRAAAIGFAISMSLAFLVIPVFGAIGTAWVQAIGLSLTMILMTRACQKHLGFAPLAGLVSWFRASPNSSNDSTR